ncbi:30S ribosomal protein S17 [Candidatus Woesearchaeota archaeon]|nr:30S ribosomal protein S17 [Candidatus Woesearchaeota archaeon]
MVPKESCNDKKCPFHGNLKTRGMIFFGDVIKTDLHKTATVEFKRQFFIQKYERKEVRFSKIKSHNPSCINAKIGDKVKIMETRPLSKTKNFVILGVMEKGLK